jgi:hypothetical protein
MTAPVLDPMTPVVLHEGLAKEVWRDMCSLSEERVLGFLMRGFTRDTLRDMRNDLQLWKAADASDLASMDLLPPAMHPTASDG